MLGLLTFFVVSLALLIALLSAMLMWEMTHPPRHTTAFAIARNLASSPDEVGLEFDSWTLDRPDGARLPVWDIRCKRESTPANHCDLSPHSRPTAIFIHGWGNSRIDALARINPFHKLCDRLILYDLRGHGDSERCISRLGQREPDDLIDLLRRITDECIVLVGHSMGAVIAMQAVQKAPSEVRQRIAGVIAYGPYCEFHRSLMGRLMAAGLPHRPITDVALLVLRAIGIRPIWLSETDLKGWSIPLHVIHGDADEVAPLEHGRRIVNAAGSMAALHVIHGAGHTDAHVVGERQHGEILCGFLDYLKAEK